MRRIIRKVTEDYQIIFAAYSVNLKRRMQPVPQSSMQTFFVSARTSRIITSFLMLRILPVTADLDHTVAEMNQLSCMKIRKDHLYTHVINKYYPYNASIMAICKHDDCSKIRVLDELLDQ